MILQGVVVVVTQKASFFQSGCVANALCIRKFSNWIPGFRVTERRPAKSCDELGGVGQPSRIKNSHGKLAERKQGVVRLERLLLRPGKIV